MIKTTLRLAFSAHFQIKKKKIINLIPYKNKYPLEGCNSRFAGMVPNKVRLEGKLVLVLYNPKILCRLNIKKKKEKRKEKQPDLSSTHSIINFVSTLYSKN
jgi:hypothetical protein